MTFDHLRWIFPRIWSRVVKAQPHHLQVPSVVITEVRWYSSQGGIALTASNNSLGLVPWDSTGICTKSKQPVSCERATSLLRSFDRPLRFPILQSYQQPYIPLLRWLAAPLALSQDEWRSGGHLPCDQPERSGYLRLQSRATCVLQSSTGPRHAE